MFRHLTIILTFIVIKVSVQCNEDGAVRLVNGTTLQEGRLEICVNSSWGTVCDDKWGNRDSYVVCRQLGYRENAGRAINGAYFGQGTGRIVMDNVACQGNEATLLDCSHLGLFMHNCNHNEDVSVRCVLREEQRVKNMTLSVETIDVPSPVHTALISWVLYNTTMDKPTSFDVKCHNEQYSIAVSVSGRNFSTYLIGLLPLTSYNCCVSAVYELYVADEVCIEAVTPELYVRNSTTDIPKSNTISLTTEVTKSNTISLTTEVTKSNNLMRASESLINITGGVLGFTVAILLILLTVSVVAVLYLLQSMKKRSVNSTRNDTGTSMPIHSNLSYLTTQSSHSTTKTSGPGMHHSHSASVRDTNPGEDDYSCLGPDYEIVSDSRRQPQRKNQVHAQLLSERYEYSEAHLAAATDGDGVPEAGANYEVPLSLRQNVCTDTESGNYSHLKH